MTFAKTLLGSFAVCAVLLMLAALALGSSHVEPRSPTHGLSAASVLASDGMGPDGRPGDDTPVPRMSNDVAVAPAGGTEPTG